MNNLQIDPHLYGQISLEKMHNELDRDMIVFSVNSAGVIDKCYNAFKVDWGIAPLKFTQNRSWYKTLNSKTSRIKHKRKYLWFWIHERCGWYNTGFNKRETIWKIVPHWVLRSLILLSAIERPRKVYVWRSDDIRREFEKWYKNEADCVIPRFPSWIQKPENQKHRCGRVLGDGSSSSRRGSKFTFPHPFPSYSVSWWIR